MSLDVFIQFIANLFNGFLNASNWLVTPLEIGDISITPLGFLTFGGLTAFLVIAIAKWVIS